MLIHRSVLLVLALAAVGTTATLARGQWYTPQAKYDAVGAESMPHWQPFGETNFSHDFQWFAPPIVYEYGGEPVSPNTGWFFTYERVYINVTRAEAAPQPYQGDWTWGNRFDVGYMTEEDHGWLFTAWSIDGPNLENVNSASMTSVELNKTWRLKPLHGGSFIEPMAGVRYINFNDRLTGETTENNMIGGQVGFRWYKQLGHWTVESDLRQFVGQNYQFLEETNLEEFVIMTDWRFLTQYHLTRAIALRVGCDIQYYPRGVARANDPLFNDEDMFLTSVTFGFAINR